MTSPADSIPQSEPTDTNAEDLRHLDAFAQRLRRETIPQSAPIDIIVCQTSETIADLNAISCVETVRKRGRLGAVICVNPNQDGRQDFGLAFRSAFEQIHAPLVILTSQHVQWNRDILDRLLKAIQETDIAIGARPCTQKQARWSRWMASVLRGWFWGAGVLDPHSPYRIFRSDSLKNIPVQSQSPFADIEILAKCNFLNGLIHEELLPLADAWQPERKSSACRQDKRRLFKHPQFRLFNSRQAVHDESAGRVPGVDAQKHGIDGSTGF